MRFENYIIKSESQLSTRFLICPPGFFEKNQYFNNPIIYLLSSCPGYRAGYERQGEQYERNDEEYAEEK